MSDDRLSETKCLELLASQHRQALLEQLEAEASGSHTLESLASALVRSDEMDRFQQVSLSLHHVHLPKLDDAGVLEYDPNCKTVECAGVDERLLDYIR